MYTYNSIIKSIVLCALINATFAYSQEATVAAEVKEEQLSAEHYVAHIITGAAAHATNIACVLAGYIAAIKISDSGINDWISYKMGLTPKRLKCESFGIMHTTSMTPFLLCAAAGLIIIYKTPQWTDKYLLKKKKPRTLRQNILVFCNRALVPYPLGILTGECFTH